MPRVQSTKPRRPRKIGLLRLNLKTLFRRDFRIFFMGFVLVVMTLAPILAGYGCKQKSPSSPENSPTSSPLPYFSPTPTWTSTPMVDVVNVFGAYGTGQSQFRNVWDVCVNSVDRVFVTDFGNCRVEEFDDAGNYLDAWGSGGYAPGMFSNPTGISTDSQGHIYVVDLANRLQKFTSIGGYITEWGGTGPGNGELQEPYDVVVDHSDNVFVVDSGNSRLEKFDSNGNFMFSFNSQGSTFGQFYYPNAVAFSITGYLWVADGSNVLQMDVGGSYWSGFRTNGMGLSGIAVSSSGTIWVSQSSTEIEKYSPGGTLLGSCRVAGLSDPWGMAFDSAGCLFVADRYNSQIFKLRPR